MAFFKFLAQQLRKPSGFFGKHVMGRLLNRVNDSLNVLMLELLAVNPDDRILEVGFGGGELLGRIAAKTTQGTVDGIDFSPEMVAQGAQRYKSSIAAGRMNLQVADAGDLPYPDVHFTKLCTANTIYFWDDPVAVLTELHRVLRPDGVLVLGFSPKRVIENRPFAAYGFTLYEESDVQGLCLEAGFRDVRLVQGQAREHPFFCAVGRK